MVTQSEIPAPPPNSKGCRVSLAHVLPRRVRLAVPSLAGDREACDRVGRELATDPRWQSVGVRPATGSIVLLLAAPIADVGSVVERVERALGAAGQREAPRAPAPTEGPTLLARALSEAVESLNEDLRRGLAGHADLETLVPSALAAWSILQLATTRVSRPHWSNLLWWSVQWLAAVDRAPRGVARDRVQDGT